LTDIEVPAELGLSRTSIDFEGRSLYVESALKADYALITGHCADHHGNLQHHGTSRNFGSLMAMAADCVIAEVYDLREKPLAPESIHSPGVFVHRLVAVERSSHEYQAIRR
jgi:acetate CoA/acetoacetate CoA-transferase alpha subunit